MCGGDRDATERALDWPLVDLLHALRHLLRDRATARYYLETQVWASLAPHLKKQQNAPELPEILR